MSGTPTNLLRDLVAVLRGIRTLAYLDERSRVLRSVRLALKPLATVFRGSLGGFLFVACLLWWPGQGMAESFVPGDVRVLDGDTLLVWRESGQRPIKVRLADIDAPEHDQAFGEASRRSLIELVSGKAVRIDPVAVDRYGRLVARVFVGEISVNAYQIERGMAWEYSLHHRNQGYVQLQEAARRSGVGLWAEPAPLPPSEWRRQHPFNALQGQPDYRCGQRQHCSQMVTCDEAHYHLTRCGVRALDPDGDGLPCEALCGGGAGVR